MGRKGDRQTIEGAGFCENLTPRLEALGGVTSKKMFEWAGCSVEIAHDK